jgi:hypothetical protein
VRKTIGRLSSQYKVLKPLEVASEGRTERGGVWEKRRSHLTFEVVYCSAYSHGGNAAFARLPTSIRELEGILTVLKTMLCLVAELIYVGIVSRYS